MNDQRVDIIVPTYNNFEQLAQLINSVIRYSLLYPVRFIVVNNGEPALSEQPFFKHDAITVLTPRENLGWEGGLKFGLEHSDSEFVMFMNDDTFVPESSKHWLANMLLPFHDKSVGAVGPASNVVMGPQNIFTMRESQTDESWYVVSFLIGFCLLLRRSALDAAGGIDDTLPGGDDIDLSIRLREAGYKLVHDASTFVWHFGFTTGTRIYGDHTKPGGWNSMEHTEKINHALIKKHGLQAWYDCLYGTTYKINYDPIDYEGETIRSLVTGDKVVEIGCGAVKTVPNAIGVDRVPKGQPIPVLHNAISVADVVADVMEPLPFKSGEFDTLIARHILEHCQNPLKTLKEWGKVVKRGGRLIIAVPDQSLSNTIPMNPEHLISFTPESLTSFAQAVGLELVEIKQGYNNVSFIGVYQR